jgi:hypothetical protein
LRNHQIDRNNNNKLAIFRTKRRSKSLIPLNKIEQHRARVEDELPALTSASRSSGGRRRGRGRMRERPRPPPPPTLFFLLAREEAKLGGDCPWLGRKIQCDGTGGGGRIGRLPSVGALTRRIWTAGTDPRPRTCRRIGQSGVVATRWALSCVRLRSGSGHVLGVEIVFAAGSDRFASDAVTVIVSVSVCVY